MKNLLALFIFFTTALCGQDIVSVEAIPQKINDDYWIALKYEVQEEGWHTYWKNPGEMEIPAEVVWEFPDGVTVEKTKWSKPKLYTLGDTVTFGVEDTLWVFHKLQGVEKPFKGSAMITWFACKEECTFNQAFVDFDLGGGGKDQEAFLTAFQNLPRQEPIPETPDTPAYFFPFKKGLVQGKEIKPLKDWDLTKDAGVVVLYTDQGEEAFEVAPSSPKPSFSFLSLVFFAFGGGLLLNLMPCIFPVLSIKALSLIKLTQGKRSSAIWHSMITTLGILSTFWVLVAILIISKSFGQMLGWGFQFQNSYFVGFFSILLFFAGISLMGFFEIGAIFLPSLSPKKELKASFASSFTNGVVTALISTPCTGPFLGPVLGVSLSLSNIEALTVFSFLGLGLAFPFLLITWVPPLQRMLPRPGPWMESFKWWMGLLMILTVFWLTSLFFSLAGEGMGYAMVLFYLVAGFYFAIKKLSRKEVLKNAATVMVLLVLFFGVTQFELLGKAGVSEPYNQKRIEALVAEQKPVFINFTAKWCLTCQFNKLAIEDKKVAGEMERLGVTYFVADWTEKDDKITTTLNGFGRNSVPLYLLYVPGKKEPVVLPQLLTADVLLEALKEVESDAR